MNISVHNKQFWMSNVIIVASLILATFFPTDNATQSLMAGIVFLIVLPLLFARFFLKKDASSFGVSLGNTTQGSIWFMALLSIVILCLAGVIQYTDILTQFTIPLSIRLSFLMFLIYILIAGVYIFIFEFFFRGFVFFVWEKIVGWKAIFAQAFLCWIFLMIESHGKVNIVVLLISFMAILSGFIVARSQSILYSFLFSYISAILGIVSVILFVK